MTIDYANAWQRLDEALARNVAGADSDPQMFAYLLTSTLAAFSAEGLLDEEATARAIGLLHQVGI
jgi:hypothetical protein